MATGRSERRSQLGMPGRDGRLHDHRLAPPCRDQLIVDNLTDTHEQFVHGSSIGHDTLSESDFEVTHEGRTVTAASRVWSAPAPLQGADGRPTAVIIDVPRA